MKRTVNLIALLLLLPISAWSIGQFPESQMETEAFFSSLAGLMASLSLAVIIFFLTSVICLVCLTKQRYHARRLKSRLDEAHVDYLALVGENQGLKAQVDFLKAGLEKEMES